MLRRLVGDTVLDGSFVNIGWVECTPTSHFLFFLIERERHRGIRPVDFRDLKSHFTLETERAP